MNRDSRKVLVTGGAGFIGSHVADRLLELGYKVVALDNFDSFYNGKEENVAHNLKNDRYSLIRGDILDFNTLDLAMREVDVVIHEAAQVGIRYCHADPYKADRVNVKGTLNVLLAAKKNKVRKLVYASSSAIFGLSQYLPIDEEYPTNPTSFYGATKLAGERYCTAFQKTYGLEVVCLRYFSVYGPRGRPDQVIHSFANRLLKGNAPIIFGDGKQTRDFTYISDVVEATILAMKQDEVDGVFNIGFGRELSIRNVAKQVIQAFNSDGPVEPEYREAYQGDFPRTLADNTKARKVFGWHPQVAFEEGLERFTNWFRARHEV